MAAKDKLWPRVTKAGEEMKTTGHLVLRAPALVRLAECAIRFFLSFLLSGAQIFGGYAPFGLSMVAASGPGTDGICSLLGACLGYLSFHGFTSGLRYTAAAILIFSVSFAFYDVRLFRRSWLMSVVASAMDLATGFVYLSGRGWFTVDIIFFSTELLLTGAFTWFYRTALSSWRRKEDLVPLSPRQLVCLLLLGGSLLITLTRIPILSSRISLGRFLGGVCVMASGYQCGMGVGAAVGVSAGLAIDLAGGAPFYSMAFGFVGLMAGVFRRQSRSFASIACTLSNAVCVLWTWDAGLQLSILYEVFLSSVVFLLLPESLLRRLSALALPREESDPSLRTAQLAKKRLEDTAQAFQRLADALRGVFASPRPNDGDAASVFDRTAQQVCRRCALRGTCWQREYVSTFNALNDALPTMLERGRGEKGDFPAFFSGRCLHFSDFLACANAELAALLTRRQCAARLAENRKAVCREYGALSQVLGEAAAQFSAPLTPDPAREQALRQHLAAMGVEGEASVCRDSGGRLRLDLPAAPSLSTPQALQRLSRLMEVPLSPLPRQEGGPLVLLQTEPLMVLAGAAALQKDGQTVSGDSCLCFKLPGGQFFALLCDGMGSGPRALEDSSLAQRLLEQFLRAGVGPEIAIRTVSSALALRGEESCGFTTIDLLRIDLFTGEALLCKYGAAPTFLRRGDRVRTVTASSLPAGLSGEGTPDVARFTLRAGDRVVMVSDGLLAGQEAADLAEAIAAFGGESSKELSCSLLRCGACGEDDRTVLSLQLLPRQ